MTTLEPFYSSSDYESSESETSSDEEHNVGADLSRLEKKDVYEWVISTSLESNLMNKKSLTRNGLCGKFVPFHTLNSAKTQR